MFWHPLSVRFASEREVSPRAAARFVYLAVLLPVGSFFFLRWLAARVVPPEPGAVFSLRLGVADWVVVASLLGVSGAALVAVLSGARDSAGRRRRITWAEGLLMALCAIGPSGLLVGRSLRYGVALTAEEFLYRPLLSLKERRYPYSAVRHVVLVPDDEGLGNGGEHLRIEFEDGYRFSTRRFRGTVTRADVLTIANYVSARSGLPVERAPVRTSRLPGPEAVPAHGS
jgi:hypothetical protein